MVIFQWTESKRLGVFLTLFCSRLRDLWEKGRKTLTEEGRGQLQGGSVVRAQQGCCTREFTIQAQQGCCTQELTETVTASKNLYNFMPDKMSVLRKGSGNKEAICN